MSNKYFGWDNADEMHQSFKDHEYDDDFNRVHLPVKGIATDDEVIIAAYGGRDYEGAAHIIFERNGKLFENFGSHCSCYGLEGQWDPELTTWAAINMRSYNYSVDSYGYKSNEYPTEYYDRMRKLQAEHGKEAE